MTDPVKPSVPTDTFNGSYPDGGPTQKLHRMVRWSRLIVVEGPADWVEKTRQSSMTEGVHLITSKDGVPCTISVDTQDGNAMRGVVGQMTNGDVARLRIADPATYEAVHGPGTARQHADDEDGPESSTPASKPDGHAGLYL